MTLAEVLARLESMRPCAAGWVARCPAHPDTKPSLSIREGEDGKVLTKCFAGCDYRTIIDALGGRPRPRAIGLPGSGTRSPALDDAKRTEIAQRIWRDAKPAAGTTVERYLTLCGISLTPPPSIRFAIGRHAPSQTGPWVIMVAAVQNLAGEIVAIHRTFLTCDGRKAPVEPAKMALGPIAGGAVRFAKAAETLALAEGIETALSVQQATGIPTWAALGTANLPHIELSAIVREIIICADADRNGVGERAAEAAARGFLRHGRRVRVARPPVGADFNDLLTGLSP
jgi:putative DNA primase/helicase